MDQLAGDIRFALRQLRRNPMFATAAVITMALAIAANTVVYTVVDTVLLRPLPYASPERLVEVTGYFPGQGRVPLSTAEFFDLREQRGPFTSIAVAAAISGNLTGVDVPERIESRGVSGTFFPMMGVRPATGRTFVAADELPGINAIGIISHRLWQRRFGGAPDVIGKKVLLDDDPYTVVGVMPASFSHPGEAQASPVDFWYPAGFKATPFPPPTRQQRGGQVIARLAPGVTIDHAQAMLSATAKSFAADYATFYPVGSGWDLRVRPLRDSLVGDAQTPLLLILGAVLCVLLVACANVISLQLARAVSRLTELAVRQAHGATPRRVAQQLVTEGIVLGVLAGVIGIAFTMLAVMLLRSGLGGMVPRAGEMSVNATVIGLALAMSVTTGVTTALAPALTDRGSKVITGLREGVPGAGGGRLHRRIRTALIVGELAVSLVLFVSAGLLVRTLWQLNKVDPGFDPARLLTLQLSVSYPNDPQRGRFVAAPARSAYYHEVLRRVSEVAGVEAVGGVSDLPFSQQAGVREISIDGRISRGPMDIIRSEWRAASPRYFAAMRIPLREGRAFSEQDGPDAPRVAIINATLAKRLWLAQSAIGQRIKSGPLDSRSPWMTVVGVVGDVRAQGLDLQPREQVYTSLLQNPPIVLSLAIRTAASSPAIAAAAQRAVRSVESDQPTYAARTMTSMMSAANNERHLALAGLLTFSAITILLSLVGTYGLVSYGVAQRRREFGVRMALGTRPSDLVRLVLREGVRMAAGGIVIGIILSFAASRLLSTLLFGVAAVDLPTFAILSLVLFVLVLAACYIPARRASMVAPSSALRGH